MNKKEKLNIVLFSFSLILILMISGCNGSDSNDITGNVIKDVTVTTTDPSTVDSDDSYDIVCNQDSDCGEDKSGDSYCFQGNKFVSKTLYTCVFKGTPQSYCNAKKKDSLVGCDKLSEQCRDGQCIEIADMPCQDSDGGKQPSVPGKVIDPTGRIVADECISKNIVLEAYCESGKGKAKTEQFDCEFECRQGECITQKEKYNLD